MFLTTTDFNEPVSNELLLLAPSSFCQWLAERWRPQTELPMPLTRPKRCWSLHHHNANYNVAAAMFMIETVERHLIVGDALQLLCTSWSVVGHKM